MKLDLLKLSLKKELMWLKGARKTWILLCTMFIMPFIAEGESLYPSLISDDGTYFFIILLGIIVNVGQYFLDSIYKDILRKSNNFYFNLNIPIQYDLYAKMIISFCLCVFYIFYCSIMLKDFLEIFGIIIVILSFINLSHLSYISMTFFYNSDSMLLSCYITFIFLMLFGAVTFMMNIVIYQLLFQISFFVIGSLGFKALYGYKRIRIKTL